MSSSVSNDINSISSTVTSCSTTFESCDSAAPRAASFAVLSCIVRLANSSEGPVEPGIGRGLRLNAADPSVDNIRSCTNRLLSARSRSRISCSDSESEGSLALKQISVKIGIRLQSL